MLGQLKALKSHSDYSWGRFHFLVIIVSHFDMVAEQVVKIFIWLVGTVRRIVTSETITSSSGGHRRFKWNHHFKEGAEVNMFTHDHRLNPKVPQPTSFDGVKPSFMEWSEEIIAFLAVTDYQEFLPLLAATASSKDVIESEVMFKGVLSDCGEDTRKRKQTNSRLGQRAKLITGLTAEISKFKENWSRESQLCSRRTFSS